MIASLIEPQGYRPTIGAGGFQADMQLADLSVRSVVLFELS